MATRPKKNVVIETDGPDPEMLRQIAIEREETKTENRGRAMEILEVTQEQLDATPKIEHLLRGIGGKGKVMDYLEGSDEPEARKILDIRRGLTIAEFDSVPFEALCIKAGITTKKMFGIIAAEATDQEQKAAALITRARQAEVVTATVEMALMPMGEKDREMFHKHTGFLPLPKGAVIQNIRNQVNDNSNHQSKTEVVILPALESGMKRLGDRFNTLMKEAPKALPEPEILEGDDDE